MIKVKTAVLGCIVALLAGMLLVWAIDLKLLASDFNVIESGGRWSDEDSAVPVSGNDAMWGSRTAPVTMVVFSDLEAPNCVQLARTLDQLKTIYGKDQLRLIWKNLVLPQRSSARPAANAAETVRALGGDPAFWKFLDRAFSNQQSLSPANFEKWAKEAGVNIDHFRRATQAGTFANKVDADTALARQLRMDASPSVLINGLAFPNVLSIAKYREVIDGQRTKADQLARDGVRPNRLYVELTRLNRESKSPDARRDSPPPATSATDAPRRHELPPEDLGSWNVAIEGSPIRGNKNALVTIVVFSDYQCPFCKRTEDLLSQVTAQYGDKVRIVWKDRVQAFHPRSEPAAQLAREARKQKGEVGFWAAHDKLFENNTRLEDPQLETYAQQLGLDVAKVKEAIAKKKYDAEIQADFDWADDLKAQATPYLFINGRRLAGGQSLELLKKLIDEQLVKATDLVKGGVAIDKVYETIMRGAATPASPPQQARKDLPTPGKEHPSLGLANAKVVVQLFSDFQCPYCKQSLPTLQELEQRYGRRVRIVWRNRPQAAHADAKLAAEAAAEAFAQKGNDAFWKYHDLLFDNQAKPDGLKRAALDKYAAQIGLDMTKFKTALDNHSHLPAIETDVRAADAAAISATPTYAVNGYIVGGAVPFLELRKFVVHALRESK